MTDSYPRMMLDEVEIWLSSPITKTYLQCFKFYQEQLSEMRANNGFVAPTNDDTLRNLFKNLGADEMASNFSKPIDVMRNYGLIQESIDEE